MYHDVHIPQIRHFATTGHPSHTDRAQCYLTMAWLCALHALSKELLIDISNRHFSFISVEDYVRRIKIM